MQKPPLHGSHCGAYPHSGQIPTVKSLWPVGPWPARPVRLPTRSANVASALKFRLRPGGDPHGGKRARLLLHETRAMPH